MTEATSSPVREPGLQAVPNALTGMATGLEALPGLVPLLASSAAPVCEGDVCVVPGLPGAEGAWTEVPD